MKVRSDVSNEARAVDALADSLPGVLKSTLTPVGFSLLANERKHFQQLTQTGAANGVTWPPLLPGYAARKNSMARRGLIAEAKRIGVLTGHLAKSFRFVVKQDVSVNVINVDPEANAFAVKRPIFPPVIPAPWIKSADAIIQKKLDQLEIKGTK